MSSTLTVGSLFSGVGGLDLGLERAGMRVEWQCEIDEYATKVLAKHWPDVTRFRDVRECGKHNLAPVDLICGGFPCQDISNAGKRAGLAGKRSGLWTEFHRIICEIRPHFVLVENVSALLHRGIERVLSDLSQSGYDAEWQCLRAADFGAPHLRNRVFIVAYSNGDRCGKRAYQYEQQSQCSISPDIGNDGTQEPMAYSSQFGCDTWRPEFERPVGSVQSSGRGASSAFIPNPDSKRTQVPVARVFTAKQKPQRSIRWEAEPTICRVANGIPHRVDRLRGLGNAVVPQVAEYIGRCILARVESEVA